MKLFTLELTVANHCGVLNRSTGLYARCKHNIVNLSVYGNGDPKTVVLSNNSTL